MKTEKELNKLAKQINEGDIAIDDAVTELTYEDCKYLDSKVEPDEYTLPPSCAFVWYNDHDEEFLKTHSHDLASTIFFDQMVDSGYGCGQNLESMLTSYAPYLDEHDFKELAKGFYNDLDKNERTEKGWYKYFKTFAK